MRLAKAHLEAMKPLYFDYSASTPLLPEVRDSYIQDLMDPELFANPSSQHILGRYAHARLEDAKRQLTQSLGLPEKTLLWSSSSTESIHMAILGAIEAYIRPSHTIVSWTHEHSATLGALQRARTLYDAEILLLQSTTGRIDLTELEEILKKHTVFMITFSVVHQELGIIQDYESILQLAQTYGAMVHIDASSSIGKIPPLYLMHADFITLSSHKCFGPKGIAALYIHSSRNRHIRSMLLGGTQQYGLRAGTEPVILVCAMSHAYHHIATHSASWHILCQEHHNKLKKTIDRLGIQEHGAHDLHRTPHMFNIYIPPHHQTLWQQSIMCSQGSACNHRKGLLSPALQALGLARDIIAHSYRISWCHMTSDNAIQNLITLWEEIFN